ncbi:hypothetical protein M378DRAFT_366025 [Amanita muscaria Koide BX008]|uniref:Uncharacterized protein n=1 Tax=Amanita muscaria (strain Koide BX008) TaxID=946122 RepID=A0A0C2SUH2_AMAMK|nr:hypothetical protein M378DRAFT_366025 [Amanita muscaria Koide BX008]
MTCVYVPHEDHQALVSMYTSLQAARRLFSKIVTDHVPIANINTTDTSRQRTCEMPDITPIVSMT